MNQLPSSADISFMITHYFNGEKKKPIKNEEKNAVEVIIISLASAPFFDVVTEGEKNAFFFLFSFRRHRFW